MREPGGKPNWFRQLTYLFYHKALALVFRAKMLAGIESAGLAPPAICGNGWWIAKRSVGAGLKPAGGDGFETRPHPVRRARNFGFLHPNCKRLITLLHVVLHFDPSRAVSWFKERPPSSVFCGAAMKIVRTRIRPSLQGENPVRIATPAIQGAH